MEKEEMNKNLEEAKQFISNIGIVGSTNDTTERRAHLIKGLGMIQIYLRK